MRYLTVIMVVAFLFCEAVAPLSSEAFIGGFVRRAGQEVSEFFGRKGSKELLEEGGKIGTEKVGHFISRYGTHGRRAFNLIGDDALKVAARYGREGVEMCAAHSAKEARFLAKHADDAVSVWRRFGKQGTTLMLKHPGIAKPLLDVCGKRGLVVAEKLSQKNQARFVNLAGKISRDNLDTMITWTLAKGDEVMNFLWRNKGVIVGGGSMYALLKDHEDGFTVTEIGPDGKPITVHKTHNFIQHWFGGITRHTLSSYPWFPLVAGVSALLLFFAVFGKSFTVLWGFFTSVAKFVGKIFVSVSRTFKVFKNRDHQKECDL